MCPGLPAIVAACRVPSLPTLCEPAPDVRGYPGDSRSAATWAVLLAAMGSLVVIAVDAHQVLTDHGFFRFQPGAQQAVPMYLRVDALVQVVAPQRLLELVLVCLAAATWLTGGFVTRPGAGKARRATVGLTGVFVTQSLGLAALLAYLALRPPPGADLVAVLGPEPFAQRSGALAAAAVLTVLAGLLGRILLRGGLEPEPADTSSDPAAPEPAAAHRAADAHHVPGPPLPRAAMDDDPHASYRRRPARDPGPSGIVLATSDGPGARGDGTPLAGEHDLGPTRQPRLPT